MGLEVEAQREIRALVRRDGGEDLRGVIERGLVGHEWHHE
jgi:hypothetical protein